MPSDEAVGCGTSLAYGIAGAVIIGFPSFLVGFIGPIILTPHANQGPLLGIFITGPAGAVIGFIAVLSMRSVEDRSVEAQHTR